MLRNLVVLTLATWLILLCFERSMESGSDGARGAQGDFVAGSPPLGELPVVDISAASNSGDAQARSLNNQGVLRLLDGLASTTDARRRHSILEARRCFDQALEFRDAGEGGGASEPDNRDARAI